jgi:hypothetical protein
LWLTSKYWQDFCCYLRTSSCGIFPVRFFGDGLDFRIFQGDFSARRSRIFLADFSRGNRPQFLLRFPAIFFSNFLAGVSPGFWNPGDQASEGVREMASRRGALYGLGGAGQRESEAGLLGGRRRFGGHWVKGWLGCRSRCSGWRRGRWLRRGSG